MLVSYLVYIDDTFRLGSMILFNLGLMIRSIRLSYMNKENWC